MTYRSSAYLEERRAETADAVILWIYAGGTLELHPYYARFAVARSAELHDSTPGNVADKAYLTGPRDATAHLTCYNTAESGSVLEEALAEGTFGTLVYGRHGSAPGQPRRGFSAYVRRFAETLSEDGLALFEIEFQKSGAVVYGPGSVW